MSFSLVLFCVSHRLCLCFCPFHYSSPHRILRTLLPITTKRAIRLSGQSAVHSAADGGQADCLSLLIQKGYDVNALLEKHISGRRQLKHTCSCNSTFKKSIMNPVFMLGSKSEPQTFRTNMWTGKCAFFCVCKCAYGLLNDRFVKAKTAEQKLKLVIG